MRPSYFQVVTLAELGPSQLDTRCWQSVSFTHRECPCDPMTKAFGHAIPTMPGKHTLSDTDLVESTARRQKTHHDFVPWYQYPEPQDGIWVQDAGMRRMLTGEDACDVVPGLARQVVEMAGPSIAFHPGGTRTRAMTNDSPNTNTPPLRSVPSPLCLTRYWIPYPFHVARSRVAAG
jgi:hypothetical protein